MQREYFEYTGKHPADGEQHWYQHLQRGDAYVEQRVQVAKQNFDAKANYLFFLKATGAEKINDRNAVAFMPRGAQFGYIFTSEIKNVHEPITVAHELGHGRFKFFHTFDKHYGSVSGSDATDNLMDYNNGGYLGKWQWDVMHDPAMLVSVFEGDEKSAMAGSALAGFYQQASPLLEKAEFKEWVEKVQKVYEFLKNCNNEGWESYNGEGIIPHCFWRDQNVSPSLYYSNADLPFTAGLIDGAYLEIEGLYHLPQVVRDLSKLPGKVVYAYTLAYWECRPEKLIANVEEYEYVITQLAKMEKEGGVWNWVKEKWFDYKEQKEELEKYFSDCRDADELRETIEDLYGLATNWEEIKVLYAQIDSRLNEYWNTLSSTDNIGRYHRGRLVIPAATIIVPFGIGVASKAERLKDALKLLKESSAENWKKFIGRMGELTIKNAEKRIDDLVDDASLEILAKEVKYLPGPQLPWNIAETFEGLIYQNRKLTSNERYFKYHGTGNKTGRKYTWVVKRKYSSESELRKMLAIKEEWGIKIEFVSEFDVPAGIWVSEGKAAAQGLGYPGGDYQAVILNIPSSWIIRIENAFK